jgi:hypothetical protein
VSLFALSITAAPPPTLRTAPPAISTPAAYISRWGLCRDVMQPSMTVYIDEYRKQQVASNEF